MTLFEQLVYEILREDNTTATDRLKAATDAQRNEIKKLKDDLSQYFKDSNIKLGGIKYGEDFRLQVQNTPVDVNWIDLAMKNMGYNYDLEVIKGGEKGSKSRSLPTIKITTDLGSIVYIVLSGLGKKSNRKEFAPNKYGIEGKDYTYQDLYDTLKEEIPKKGYAPKIEQYLLNSLETVVDGSITFSSNIYKVKKVKEDVEIERGDLNNIQNDFGEILGAMVIAREEDEHILFPVAANEPLVDYEVGNFRYSAKSLAGAAPTITALAEKYYNYVKNEMDYPGDKNVLAEMFEYITNKKLKTEQSYIAITKAVSEDGWSAFLDFMGESSIDPEDSGLIDKIKERLDEYFEMGTLEENLDVFYTKLTTRPKTPISKYDPEAKWRSGYVTSALSYYVPKVLNSNVHGVKDAMKMIINQMEDIKQVNFYNRDDAFEFKITEFVDDNLTIRFEGGGSVVLPNDKKLRFKIKI